MVQFVIPSYQRAQKLKDQTLKFLSYHTWNKDVWIFVRDDDPQIEEYRKLSDDNYNVIELIDCRGIGNTHNAITTYFTEGEWICELDDDIIDVINNKRESLPNHSLQPMLQKMIDIMEPEKITYGGFYQCDNPMFMSGNNEYTKDLRYCLGLMRLRRIDYSIVLETNYAEDFENCILHYIKDGAILKNNWIAGKTKNYAEGGCDGDGRNIETEKADKEFLASKYPDHCKLFQRKNGRWDLRLKNPKQNKCPSLTV